MAIAPVTDNRRTRLALDITETTVGRREWNIIRTAAEIQRDRANLGADAPKSSNVWHVGGEAWILAPIGKELAELNRTDAEPPLTSADVNLAPGFESMLMFKRSDDLPGIGASASTVAAGFTAFVKSVTAGFSWNTSLAADAMALPAPAQEVEDGDDNYPIDRVLSSTKTFPERAPFALRWYLPEDFSGTDAFLIYYFGGPTDVTPDGQHGGQFALTLRGGGTARLYEYSPNPAVPAAQWKRRMEWKYSDPGGFKGRMEALYAIPYARNRIEFRSASALWIDPRGGFTMVGVLANIVGLIASLNRASGVLFKDLPAITGHSHQRATTGAGNVRLDVNRSARIPVSIARMLYPNTDADPEAGGTLVDAPFFIPWTLDEETPITLHVDAYLPDNTSVAGSLYNAADDSLLAQDDDNNWLSVPDQQEYYVKIALACIDGTQTPVVWGYRVNVANDYQTNTRTANTAAPVTRVSVQYQDPDPSTESADLAVRDILNAAPILRQRDGIRSMLQIRTANGSTLVSNLFEGDTMSPVSTKRGTAGQTYPAPDWHDVDLRMVGLWGRLEETYVIVPVPFNIDDDAGLDPLGNPIPWKATDAIRHLFNDAGFNDDDLDIPDLSIRLWVTPDGLQADDLVLMTGVSYGAAIRRIAWDFLRMVIVRDVNCRSGQYEGKWRLIQNPIPPYDNILASFHITNPGGLSGKMPHMIAAYTAGESYVRRGEFRQYPIRVECNQVFVCGVGPDGKQYWSIATNQPSIDDPNSADYIGRAIPVYFPPDPTLPTQEAADWACRIIYDAAAHAQKWASLEAPLLLVTDSEDDLQVRPRPLRINDLINIAGLPAVVRDVRVDYDGESGGDTVQMMNLTALFLNDTTWSAAAASSQTALRKQVASMVGASQGARPTSLPPIFQKQVMNPQTAAHHRNLPIRQGSRQSLQESDGSFKFMMDYDPIM